MFFSSAVQEPSPGWAGQIYWTGKSQKSQKSQWKHRFWADWNQKCQKSQWKHRFSASTLRKHKENQCFSALLFRRPAWGELVRFTIRENEKTNLDENLIFVQQTTNRCHCESGVNHPKGGSVWVNHPKGLSVCGGASIYIYIYIYISIRKHKV